MASKRKKTFIIGIAVAFLLPLFSFFIFTRYTKGVIKLPKHYGILFIDTIHLEDGQVKYDTVYKETAPVTLVNQLGKQVNLNKDLRGKILVIHFTDSRDTSIRKIMVSNLQNLEYRFQEKAYKKPKQDNLSKSFQLISISLSPALDNVSSLRKFADNHHIKSDNWWLLTGDSASIFNYVEKELNVPLAEKSAEPLRQIVLVDTFRHIRGYFDGLDTFQLKTLADDISILTMEKRK